MNFKKILNISHFILFAALVVIIIAQEFVIRAPGPVNMRLLNIHIKVIPAEIITCGLLLTAGILMQKNHRHSVELSFVALGALWGIGNIPSGYFEDWLYYVVSLPWYFSIFLIMLSFQNKDQLLPTQETIEDTSSIVHDSLEQN